MKLSQLKINPNNPRIIKDERFDKLVKSIKDFPKMLELRPIIIDDNFIILGGNMRFKALKELGFKEIPDEWVKKASELTEEEKQRFIIEDNIPFGEWDYDLLGEWNKIDLGNWGLELEEKEPRELKLIELKPYKKTHILISFEPERIIELKDLLDKILELDFIEYEQSSN